MEHIDTLVIGAGQAGLSTSYWLKQAGREHLVLEKSPQPAYLWRTERWDSFTLVTPNWLVDLPGSPYAGPDPDGFMSRQEIIDYFDNYVASHSIDVQTNTRVESVSALDGRGFTVETGKGRYRAENVIVATGFEQFPKIPPMASSLSDSITQLHSSAYRKPEALPPGGVLVVGSAQSGAQIAEELYQSGRQVFLSVGGAGRAPRRYRGKDTIEWLIAIGFFELPVEHFPGPAENFAPPHISGRDGGHTLNLHQFAQDGVTLLGHLQSVEGTGIRLAPDLHQMLDMADNFAKPIGLMIDQYIAATGIEAPEAGPIPELRDGFAQPQREGLDLAAEGISTVIWATGFDRDHSFVKFPVTDERGFLIQNRGVTRHPGLSFVGMCWTPGIKPVTLMGAGDSARHVVESIVDRPRVRQAA